MAVLGIESSAHTFGAGVVSDGRVLSNEKEMYRITNQGIIPVKVSEFHRENFTAVINKALKQAGLKIGEIEAIGYTRGPGIGPCLRIGELAAATLAKAHHIPLYPVNHGVAHIEIARQLAGFSDPLALYVSGGNSQLVARSEQGFRHYHIYGETLDIGVGNMLDSFARAAGMDPAWGSSVAKAAEGGSYLRMPYTVKGMDFTFTGLLTRAIEMLQGHRLRDVCLSLQETAFSMLCEAAERALLLTGRRELVACGGVAQSRRLAEMLGEVAASHGFDFYVAPDALNADNGAMIALVAEKMDRCRVPVKELEYGTKQRYRIDSFRVWW